MRILGIDYGDVRVGLAVCDPTGFLASGIGNVVIKGGCLYLGDYNAKDYFEELFEAYKEVWPTIDIIQIPHHGSLKNFKEKLIVKGGCHVISNKEKPTSTTNVNSSEVECRIKRNGGVVVTTFDGDKTIRLVRDGVTLKNIVIG